MKLQLRTVRSGSKRETGEGLRIGTVRYLPRGVKKEDYSRLDYFDVWLPIVAPSRKLLSELKAGGMSVKTFFARYRREMRSSEPAQVIRLLAEFARRTPISVCCYCEDESVCHRRALADLIREAARTP